MHVELEFEWRRTGGEITNVDLRTVISSVNDVAERVLFVYERERKN